MPVAPCGGQVRTPELSVPGSPDIAPRSAGSVPHGGKASNYRRE